VRRRISFHRLAEAELNDAAQYYDHVSPGLGATFLDEAEHAIQQILAFPESAPEVSPGVRRKLIRKFPYGVLYSIREYDIRILAVMNLRRRPFYWRGRS
jgi:plasmid stabilization system protein ParE